MGRFQPEGQSPTSRHLPHIHIHTHTLMNTDDTCSCAKWDDGGSVVWPFGPPWPLRLFVQRCSADDGVMPYLSLSARFLIHSYSPDVACQSLCPVECSHRKRSGAVLPLFPLSYHFVATIIVSCYSYLSYFVDLVMSWSGSIWLHIAL